jgi:LacI family transcriptional regulator
MKDVAEHAGVSQTTVSFVLNEVPHVTIPDETRARVWAAINELEYRPNALARGLRSQRTHTMGFISDEVASAPFAGKMIAGAQAAAWAHDHLLLLVNTGGNQSLKEAAVETLLERQVEGIVHATMYHRVAQPPATLHEVPAVLLDCYVEDRSLPSVVPDEVQGGHTATECLLRKGHRRIGFINVVDPIPAAAGRLQGYREALATYDLPFDERLVASRSGDAHGGYQATLHLMQQPTPPTALFCFNDRVAMGAYEALRRLGCAIPDDVAVVGFDNQEIIAAGLYPPLTTVQLPHYQMGQWAVNYLIQHAGSHPDPSPLQHRIECPLVLRNSV